MIKPPQMESIAETDARGFGGRSNRRKSDHEAISPIMSGLQGDAAAIGLRRPLRDGQSKAAPACFPRAGGIDSEKSFEDLLPKILRDTFPAVFYSNVHGFGV